MRNFGDTEPPQRCYLVAETSGPTPTPENVAARVEDVEPPGTRVLASSFKPNGTRYRPGERLEKQARAHARERVRRTDDAPAAWTRDDAHDTLARLMESLRLGR